MLCVWIIILLDKWRTENIKRIIMLRIREYRNRIIGRIQTIIHQGLVMYGTYKTMLADKKLYTHMRIYNRKHCWNHYNIVVLKKLLTIIILSPAHSPFSFQVNLHIWVLLCTFLFSTDSDISIKRLYAELHVSSHSIQTETSSEKCGLFTGFSFQHFTIRSYL